MDLGNAGASGNDRSALLDCTTYLNHSEYLSLFFTDGFPTRWSCIINAYYWRTSLHSIPWLSSIQCAHRLHLFRLIWSDLRSLLREIARTNLSHMLMRYESRDDDDGAGRNDGKRMIIIMWSLWMSTSLSTGSSLVRFFFYIFPFRDEVVIFRGEKERKDPFPLHCYHRPIRSREPSKTITLHRKKIFIPKKRPRKRLSKDSSILFVEPNSSFPRIN